MPVEIESILQYEDVQVLVDAGESSGSARQSEINEVAEAHEFDVFDLDLLYRELETRGVEIVDDTKEAEKAPPPPPPPPVVESTTDALQLFLREAGRHQLLTAPQEVELARGNRNLAVGIVLGSMLGLVLSSYLGRRSWRRSFVEVVPTI